MSWRSWGWLSSACALWCCAPDDGQATAVAVSVKTELEAGSELQEIEYRVYRLHADLGSEPPLSTLRVPVAELARPFVVVRGEADAFLLSIAGYGEPSGSPVIGYQAQVHFVDQQTLALRVLLARACYQRDCAFPGLTCYGQALDGVPAGGCAAIPTPELARVTRPGEESEW